MAMGELIVTIVVLLALFLMIYSKMKNMSLKEAWDDFMEMVNPVDKVQSMPGGI